MTHRARLARLERARPPGAPAVRRFNERAGTYYAIEEPARGADFNYSAAIEAIEALHVGLHEEPAPSVPRYTRAQIEQLARAGGVIEITHYADCARMWRGECGLRCEIVTAQGAHYTERPR